MSLAALRAFAWRRLLSFFLALFPRAAMAVLLCEGGNIGPRNFASH